MQRVDIKEFDRWETMLRILYNRGSRGLLVEQVDPVMHDMIRNFGLLPVVCCERQHGLRFHTVRHAVADRVRLCWAKLREAGYRRIGFAHYEHPDLLIDDHDRLGAALTLLHKTPKRDHLPPLELSSIRTPEERNAYREWLSRHRPDAVIGFRAGLWLDGREHPNQPRAFVSLHTSPGNQDAGPVAGATHNTDVFAREAISLLDRSIRHGETGLPDFPVDVVIPPLWFDASGIPPAKG